MGKNSDGKGATGNRCAIYVRVSTAGQERDGTSLETQEAACREYAESHGYTVVGVYRDAHTGTELWERPQLTLLRERVRQREIDVLLAFDPDRAFRSQVYTAIVLEECQRHGCRLDFVLFELEDSAQGRFLLSARQFVAELELEKIRERTVRGKRARLTGGKIHNHGPELFGYRRDKEAGVRLIHEYQAAIVRRIFERIGVDGASIRSLVKQLNDEGIPTPSAGKQDRDGDGASRWGTGVIHRMVRNPAYKGETIEWRTTGHGGKRNPTEKPQDEWIRLPEGTTPAIVTSELWAAVQARLESNKGDSTRNRKHFYLLRGLIRCAVCGQKMRPEPEHNYRVYRCYSRDTPAGPCGGKRAPAEIVEAGIWEAVASRLRDPSIIAAELKRRRDEEPDVTLSSDLEAARRMLSRLEKQQAGLARRLADSPEDDSLWELVQREIKRIESEKQAIGNSIGEMEQRLETERQAVVQLDSLRAYCERVAHNLDAFGPEEKRLALEAMGVQITANGREWEGRGSIPFGASSAGVVSLSSERCGDLMPLSPGPASRAPDP